MSGRGNKRKIAAVSGELSGNVAKKGKENGGSDSLRAVSPIPDRKNSLDEMEVDASSKATLVLNDGTTIAGFSFGAPISSAGEVVFNTGMVGYPEALSDPSYRGQILVLTYPLVGNYGVPSEDKLDEFGLPKDFESHKIQISGLIVADYSAEYSHWNAKQSLGAWLTKNNIPALYGVDTRMLTKKIRETGAMLGKIEFEGQPIVFDDPNKRNLVAEVSTSEVRVFNKGAKPRILAYDCGMKYNIIRYLARMGVELTVVPYNYDAFKGGNVAEGFDGVFLSNGPGDPSMAKETVESVKKHLAQEPPVPVFGICLGNQILSLAAGAKTYKMKFGNRGMNQPCIDMRTGRCYITPQNHGFAVDSDSLPKEWRTFFLNANDNTNEGVIHATKPFFSVQFHPEACGGPLDTAFLFDEFLSKVNGKQNEVTTLSPETYMRPVARKVLIVGSGGLSIGQAGEFDYSGSQAIKALREEGIETVLINPNIATVQTSKGMADHVYFLPVTAPFVLEVIKKEKPDSILVSMGGQTALNVGVQLYEAGEFEKHNCRVLGTQIPTINMTEDREVFAQELAKIGESCALSYPANSVDEALQAARKIGFPVLVRAAFALGGLGSGFANNEEELKMMAKKAFALSPQILIDQDLRGWKEVEYEVVRDQYDNCITVCNMENFDPLGIHTGDSIVVAPSQTLSNAEYFKLRSVAIKVVRHLGVVGECNIQYALNPESEQYCIIEVNARLSRSSALASKATGYPLAYVATKLALGMDLVTIRNQVTKVTTACFEPSLDYCVVKIPRFDLKKFQMVSNKVGSSMKSVGEVMAIGRSFEETIQKALRMMDPQLDGFEAIAKERIDEYRNALATPGVSAKDLEKVLDIDHRLMHPDHQRIFAVADAFMRGYTCEKIHSLCKIDMWFLSKLENVFRMTKAIEGAKSGLSSISRPSMRALKCAGFSDRQIAKACRKSTGGDCTELEVRKARLSMGIRPYTKQIDTLAAEFPAQTNYLYMTYNGSDDDVPAGQAGIVVLGCGPYCIGSSVEFDWGAVSCVRQLKKDGFQAVVINFNPETVSTDFDESDRLYFEELSFERVCDVYEFEQSNGVVVSVGGQIPNQLAMPLSQNGVKIMGTTPESIDRAEDRNKFSALLDDLGIDQPKWVEATGDSKELSKCCEELGYPVLVRPSYVLSGAAMAVAGNFEELTSFLRVAGDTSSEHPVVVSKFITGAKEIEFDGVAAQGKILNYAISEHVENAGVHSGDATLVLPAQSLYVETIRRVKKIAEKIAMGLSISGPFNIQFISKSNDVKVIECNLRASRSFPFVSKTFDFNFISLATRVMTGLPVKPKHFSLIDLDYVATKAPMFSFTRLAGADPTLGVEMHSTGEVACFGRDLYESFILSLISSGFKVPEPSDSRSVLVSIGSTAEKAKFLSSAHTLTRLGYKLLATPGTAAFLKENGVEVKSVHKPKSKQTPNALDALQNEQVSLVINLVNNGNKTQKTDGYFIRRTAVDFGISLLTNLKCAVLLAEALAKKYDEKREWGILSMGDNYKKSQISF